MTEEKMSPWQIGVLLVAAFERVGANEAEIQLLWQNEAATLTALRSVRSRVSILNQSMRELGFCIRAIKAARSALGVHDRIPTVAQLLTLTSGELLKIKNFNQQSLKNIEDKLMEHGLTLKSDE